jgi:hypothetical protein
MLGVKSEQGKEQAARTAEHRESKHGSEKGA